MFSKEYILDYLLKRGANNLRPSLVTGEGDLPLTNGLYFISVSPLDDYKFMTPRVHEFDIRYVDYGGIEHTITIDKPTRIVCRSLEILTGVAYHQGYVVYTPFKEDTKVLVDNFLNMVSTYKTITVASGNIVNLSQLKFEIDTEFTNGDTKTILCFGAYNNSNCGLFLLNEESNNTIRLTITEPSNTNGVSSWIQNVEVGKCNLRLDNLKLYYNNVLIHTLVNKNLSIDLEQYPSGVNCLVYAPSVIDRHRDSPVYKLSILDVEYDQNNHLSGVHHRWGNSNVSSELFTTHPEGKHYINTQVLKGNYREAPNYSLRFSGLFSEYLTLSNNIELNQEGDYIEIDFYNSSNGLAQTFISENDSGDYATRLADNRFFLASSSGNKTFTGTSFIDGLNKIKLEIKNGFIDVTVNDVIKSSTLTIFRFNQFVKKFSSYMDIEITRFNYNGNEMKMIGYGSSLEIEGTTITASINHNHSGALTYTNEEIWQD